MEEGGVVLMDLLWSDPTTNDGVEGVQPSPRGPGLVTFGPDRVKEFCKVRPSSAADTELLPSLHPPGGIQQRAIDGYCIGKCAERVTRCSHHLLLLTQTTA